jgi:hypothetical protein
MHEILFCVFFSIPSLSQNMARVERGGGGKKGEGERKMRKKIESFNLDCVYDYITCLVMP